jgi:superfamily II RNA helicase
MCVCVSCVCISQLNTVTEELIATEMIFDNLLTNLTPEEAVALLSCMIFEEKTDNEPLLTPQYVCACSLACPYLNHPPIARCATHPHKSPTGCLHHATYPLCLFVALFASISRRLEQSKAALLDVATSLALLQMECGMSHELMAIDFRFKFLMRA